MKANKCLVLLLAVCLILSLALAFGVAAEDEAAAETTGETAAETTGEAATETTGEAAKTGLSTGTIISLSILGVVVVVLVVLAIVKRKKLAERLRSYKSEMKKITWYPWKQVWRNTVLVIVIVLATAAVVGLLDFAFFQGQAGLVKLFGAD